MSHPVRKNPSRSRFNPELSIDQSKTTVLDWLLRNTLSGYTPTIARVENLSHKFIRDFTSYINNAQDDQIPAMIDASKLRASRFINFCQDIITLVNKGYHMLPLTRDAQLIKSNYKVRFTRQILAHLESDPERDVLLDVNITANPRCYRTLYDIAILSLNESPTDCVKILILVQSLAEYYKSVLLTNQEIIKLEEEFLACATDTSKTYQGSELESLVSEIKADIRKDQPPKYVEDIKSCRRAVDGYLHNHKWSEDDMIYSSASSGCRLTINGANIPNIALIFSAGETDIVTPIDELIGYESFYPSEPYPGMEVIPSVSKHVPKTSSRGERWIHTNQNGRQDRGNYFEKMMKHLLETYMLSDNTFWQPKGIQNLYTKICEDIKNEIVIIGSDIHSATDYEDHDGLLDIWSILFKEKEIPKFLLWLHSGEGLIEIHDKNTMELKTIPYTQVRGIKCGTRSNFSIGLAFPHHIVVRATMAKLGLKDRDPRDFYDLLGDDINHYLKNVDFLDEKYHQGEPINMGNGKVTHSIPDWKVWFNTYQKLAKELGFRVHSLEDKGMVADASHDITVKGEFAKQTWSRDGIISGIPYRIFFKNVSAESVLSSLIWLAKYKSYPLTSSSIDAAGRLHGPEDINIFRQIWNFSCEHEILGIPKALKCALDYDYIPVINDKDIAINFFLETLRTSVFDELFNKRNRLTERAVENRIKKFTTYYDNDELLTSLIEWQVSHCNGKLGKLALSYERNRRFKDDLSFLDKSYYLALASNLNIFSNKDKEIIRRALPYVRFENFMVPGEDPVSILIEARNLLKEKQPTSMSKKTGRSSHTLINILHNCEVLSRERHCSSMSDI